MFFPARLQLFSFFVINFTVTILTKVHEAVIRLVCRSVSGNSIMDHLQYFGIQLQAETWGSCRIVLVDRSMIKDDVDLNGNFALSRDPTTSVIKLTAQLDAGHRLSAY